MTAPASSSPLPPRSLSDAIPLSLPPAGTALPLAPLSKQSGASHSKPPFSLNHPAGCLQVVTNPPVAPCGRTTSGALASADAPPANTTTEGVSPALAAGTRKLPSYVPSVTTTVASRNLTLTVQLVEEFSHIFDTDLTADENK